MNLQPKALEQVQPVTLLQKLDFSPGKVILDLGSYASGTLQAFLKRGCRCYVEDLPELLNLVRQDPFSSFSKKLTDHLVVTERKEKVDYILMWDLFHYLDLLQIEKLFLMLKCIFKPSTIIHAVRHTSPQIPETPTLFKLSDNLEYHVKTVPSVQQIVNHAHTTIELLRKIEPFSIYETLTHKSNLTKGLIEYSLSYEKRTPQAIFKPTTSSLVNYDESNYSLPNASSIKLPGLSKILTQLNLEKADSVLNCNSANIDNRILLNQLSRQVFFEDIYSPILWQQKHSGGNLGNLNRKVLTYADSVKFDLILLWDLFNFIEQQNIQLLSERLAGLLKPKGKIHCIIPHSNTSTNKPSSFNILDDFSVDILGERTKDDTFKFFTSSELIKLLPNFKVLTYYFGTHKDGSNYQEFIFERKN